METAPHFATLRFGDRFEGETAAFSGGVAYVRAFVGAVGEARPVTTGALETKAFHEGEFDGFHRVPLEGPGVVRDNFALAIVTGVGVSEMEHRCYSIHGSLFQRTIPPVACEQEREFLATGIKFGFHFFSLCFEAIAFIFQRFDLRIVLVAHVCFGV